MSMHKKPNFISEAGKLRNINMEEEEYTNQSVIFRKLLKPI